MNSVATLVAAPAWIEDICLRSWPLACQAVIIGSEINSLGQRGDHGRSACLDRRHLSSVLAACMSSGHYMLRD